MRIATFYTFLVLKVWRLLLLCTNDNKSILPNLHTLEVKYLFEKISAKNFLKSVYLWKSATFLISQWFKAPQIFFKFVEIVYFFHFMRFFGKFSTLLPLKNCGHFVIWTHFCHIVIFMQHFVAYLSHNNYQLFLAIPTLALETRAR